MQQRRSIAAAIATVLAAAVLATAPAAPTEAAHVNLVSDSVVDASALTFNSGSYGHYPNGVSFQQDGVTTFNGYQYATYYNSSRRVCVARRALPSGSWQTACFTEYTAATSDTHNVATIGISHGDGTIHLAFDHHVSTLHYRVSIQGVATNPTAHTWSTSLFGATTDQLVPGTSETSVTYPRFISSPDGGLTLIRRSGGSGNGPSLLYRYDATTHAWTRHGSFISATGTYPGGDGNRNAYLDYPQYDDSGRLHLTWMWRETTGGATNHDLNYAYSDDDGLTWYNGAGTHVGTTGTTLLSVTTPGLQYAPLGMNRGLMNQQSAYVDGDGVVHVITQHMPAALPDDPNGTALRVYHHYWRDLTGAWQSRELSFVGSRPKVVVTDDGDPYFVFVTGGALKIAHATAASGYNDWQVIWAGAAGQYGGEPLIDWNRWRDDGILSVYVQEAYATAGTGTPLHVLDFVLEPGAPIAPPIGEWRLDEASGTATTDVAGANHGTLVNGATRVTGVRGNAVQLDGTNDYVNVPDATVLDGMAQLSVSMWVKLDALPALNYIPLGKDSNGSAQSSYRFAISAAGVPSFAIKTSANGWYTTGTVASGGTVSTGTWRHLVGTYDGTTVRFYLDGVLQGTGAAPVSGAIATGTSPLRLGFNAGANANPLDGAVDEVQVFTTALTAAEVAEFFASY